MGYNETGNCKNDSENGAWEEYKAEIEHIVIGNNISKVSNGAFNGYTALKDVALGKNIGQIDAYAFSGFTSLTTICVGGDTPVEYTADLNNLSTLNESVLAGTKIRNFILNKGCTKIGTNSLPNTTATITCTPNDEFIEYAKNNYVNIIDIETGAIAAEYYVEIDLSLPSCGGKAVFDFDEANGTLTVKGVGAISDIVNYYRGGAKKQFWFDIKNKIKKVVITDGITKIGKYSFTQCANLEYVELPDYDIEIGNAALESCTNLKSVYIKGKTPVIGTVDVSGISTLNSWTFSKFYLIANVIISDKVTEIGSSVFDSSVNIQTIYGKSGSYAEKFASKNNYAFKDISTGYPAEQICEAPESDPAEETTRIETEETEQVTEPVSETSDTETDDEPVIILDHSGESDVHVEKDEREVASHL